MKTTTLASLLICLLCLAAKAQIYNNYQKEYVLTSQTAGQIEVERTQRTVLCDYQLSGLYVKKGERIILEVSNLNPDYDLSLMTGFKPMWGDRNKTQEDKLENGVNTVAKLTNKVIFVAKRVLYGTVFNTCSDNNRKCSK